MRPLALFFCLLTTMPIMSKDWTNDEERSNCEHSPIPADTIAGLERLARDVAEIAISSVGRTPWGREPKLVVASTAPRPQD